MVSSESQWSKSARVQRRAVVQRKRAGSKQKGPKSCAHPQHVVEAGGDADDSQSTRETTGGGGRGGMERGQCGSAFYRRSGRGRCFWMTVQGWSRGTWACLCDLEGVWRTKQPRPQEVIKTIKEDGGWEDCMQRTELVYCWNYPEQALTGFSTLISYGDSKVQQK